MRIHTRVVPRHLVESIAFERDRPAAAAVAATALVPAGSLAGAASASSSSCCCCCCCSSSSSSSSASARGLVAQRLALLVRARRSQRAVAERFERARVPLAEPRAKVGVRGRAVGPRKPALPRLARHRVAVHQPRELRVLCAAEREQRVQSQGKQATGRAREKMRRAGENATSSSWNHPFCGKALLISLRSRFFPSRSPSDSVAWRPAQ